MDDDTQAWARALVGAESEVRDTVSTEMTAEHLGSGDVAVLATPVVVALMERAAVAAVAPKLPAGRTTVGTSIDVQHRAPTAVGTGVTARARVEEATGARIRFAVEVADASRVVAAGVHVRAIVDRDEFLSRIGHRETPRR